MENLSAETIDGNFRSCLDHININYFTQSSFRVEKLTILPLKVKTEYNHKMAWTKTSSNP